MARTGVTRARKARGDEPERVPPDVIDSRRP
jgi:hypothetical protein